MNRNLERMTQQAFATLARSAYKVLVGDLREFKELFTSLVRNNVLAT